MIGVYLAPGVCRAMVQKQEDYRPSCLAGYVWASKGSRNGQTNGQKELLDNGVESGLWPGGVWNLGKMESGGFGSASWRESGRNQEGWWERLQGSVPRRKKEKVGCSSDFWLRVHAEYTQQIRQWGPVGTIKGIHGILNLETQIRWYLFIVTDVLKGDVPKKTED